MIAQAAENRRGNVGGRVGDTEGFLNLAGTVDLTLTMADLVHCAGTTAMNLLPQLTSAGGVRLTYKGRQG